MIRTLALISLQTAMASWMISSLKTRDLPTTTRRATMAKQHRRKKHVVEEQLTAVITYPCKDIELADRPFEITE